MGFSCKVKCCKNTYTSLEPPNALHRFPTDEKQLNLWAALLGLERAELSSCNKICSLHFENIYLLLKKCRNGYLTFFLSKDAIPTKLLYDGCNENLTQEETQLISGASKLCKPPSELGNCYRKTYEMEVNIKLSPNTDEQRIAETSRKHKDYDDDINSQLNYNFEEVNVKEEVLSDCYNPISDSLENYVKVENDVVIKDEPENNLLSVSHWYATNIDDFEKDDPKILSTEEHLTNINTTEILSTNSSNEPTEQKNPSKKNTFFNESKKPKRTFKKQYPCHTCEKIFTQSSDLVKHERTHTKEKPYVCEICPKAYSQSSHLQQHKRTHTGEKNHFCDVCGTSFYTSGHLKQHKSTHTGEKSYECDICHKAYSQSAHLTEHKLTHTGEKNYVCDVCNKTFTRLSTFRGHRRTHTGEKSHVCDVCGRGFVQSSCLVAHRRIHSGEKPYACGVCHKEFVQSSSLVIHERTHTNEKPYDCDICHRRFNHSSNLKRHRLVHTGQKSYVCDVCDRAFSQASILARHKNTHRGVQ